jgi:Protein of unknown function (DUF992)
MLLRVAAPFLLTLSAFTLSIDTAASQAAPKLTRLGTLTCTTGDAPQRPAADAKLSCNFEASSGASGNFTGFIARKGRADLPAGKRVLIWSVLAPRADIGIRDLAGEYRGTTGGRTAGRLVGGSNRSIVLQPVTSTSQVGDQPVPTVLRLRLEPTRA